MAEIDPGITLVNQVPVEADDSDSKANVRVSIKKMGALGAGENFMGLVGNKQVIVSASFNRPGDTNTYANGDVVCDSTSAPTVMTFVNAARVDGGGGIILDAALIDSANVSTKGIFDLFIFDKSVVTDNDNAAFTPTDTELATCVGVITFDTNFIGDLTSGAGGNAIYKSGLLNLPFIIGTAAKDLYGVLVARNAYVPVNAETFTVRLNIIQN